MDCQLIQYIIRNIFGETFLVNVLNSKSIIVFVVMKQALTVVMTRNNYSPFYNQAG